MHLADEQNNRILSLILSLVFQPTSPLSQYGGISWLWPYPTHWSTRQPSSSWGSVTMIVSKYISGIFIIWHEEGLFNQTNKYNFQLNLFHNIHLCLISRYFHPVCKELDGIHCSSSILSGNFEHISAHIVIMVNSWLGIDLSSSPGLSTLTGIVKYDKTTKFRRICFKL